MVMIKSWEKERVKNETDINIDNKTNKDSKDGYNLNMDGRDSI